MRDIYVFGAAITISYAICAAIALIVGLAFGVLFEVLLFFVSFTLLRTSAGGAHAEKFIVCAVISAGTILLSAVCIKFIPPMAYMPVIVFSSIFSLTVIFALAPFEHPNRPLTGTELTKFRKRSRLVVTGCVLISLSLYILDLAKFGTCLSLGNLAASVSTIAAFINKKIRRRKK
jgi:accessory gene regulator B